MRKPTHKLTLSSQVDDVLVTIHCPIILFVLFDRKTLSETLGGKIKKLLKACDSTIFKFPFPARTLLGRSFGSLVY